MSQLFVDNIKNRTGGAIGAPSGAVVTGIVTATTFDGNVTGNAGLTGTPDITVRNITGVAATFTGVLTYEDVTNIDSIGIITARSGVSIGDSIFHTGDTNTAIRFPAADTFTVETAGSERTRVDSSGNLIIGSTSAATNSQITLRSASPHLSLYGTPGSNTSQLNLGDTDDHDIGNISYDHSDNSMRFTANASERLRITSAGAAIFKGGLAEKYENAGTTLGAQTNQPLSDGNVILFTGNESGNKTINFTGVHATLSNGETVSFTAILTPNNSGKITVVQVDGQAITVKWSGGSAPSAGASGQDIYTFQILKTGTGVSDYTVFGAAANYA